MLIFLLLLLLIGTGLLSRIERRGAHHSRGDHRAPCVPTSPQVRGQPKPAWVRAELIRLKAWSPGAGCRVVAEIFNRQFAERGVTVGKTYVAGVLCRSKYDIVLLRRTLKHRVPRPSARNRTWALDLTGKTDITGRQHMLLGLLDHGTRACLDLVALPDKRSLTILRAIIPAFRRYGLPARIRVDNEICFNSRLMRGVLTVFGVHLQTIELHCPWQNGRIERFFGTLKQKLDAISIADGHELAIKLLAFRAWYNHVRPHQHLLGHTPAEVWAGRDKSLGTPERFSAWEGRLTGWFFPP